MYIDFSGLFHQSSKDVHGGGRVAIPFDDEKWPEEWKTVHYKAYPRLKRIALPHTAPVGAFADLIKRRRSSRKFGGDAIGVEKMASLLKFSCGITEEYEEFHPRRAHPSGGGRYPIEVYPLVFSGDSDIPSGVYHYDIKGHALEALWQKPFLRGDIAELSGYPWLQDASCLLVLTALFDRSHAKYGERGYRYIILEAGHIGQNVYLNAAAHGLNCAALGGTHDEVVEKLLDIDGISESLVYTIALG